MAISQTQLGRLICPSCGRQFEAELWALIDSGERPDLRDALAEGTLNQAACPQCGAPAASSGPLLLHDPGSRRVYFAVPADVDEHIWHEEAQMLLYKLIEALPEEARLPYLGDVQVEQEIEGVRRALTRRRRGRPAPVAAAGPDAAPARVVAPAPAPPPPLLDWVQVLLSADTPAEFRATVVEHPELLGDAADALLEALAGEALAAGEREAAGAIRRVRATLADLRAAQAEPEAAAVLERHTVAGTIPPDVSASGEAPTVQLADDAYQSFLAAGSSEDLLDAARGHPSLLEPWAETLIAAQGEDVLDNGNERLAALIDERREALAALRDELLAEESLQEAVAVLLAAEGEEAITRALDQYPALLTGAAQEALLTIAAGASAAGDEPRAAEAIAYCAMLREVRQGLEAT
jgi:hypothetical protein